MAGFEFVSNKLSKWHERKELQHQCSKAKRQRISFDFNKAVCWDTEYENHKNFHVHGSARHAKGKQIHRITVEYVCEPNRATRARTQLCKRIGWFRAYGDGKKFSTLMRCGLPSLDSNVNKHKLYSCDVC